MYGELDLAEGALTEGFYDGVLPHASLWISSFWTSILARVRVLTGVMVAVGVVRTVRVGGGLGVLGRVLLWGLWLWLLLVVVVVGGGVAVVAVVVLVLVVVVVLLGGWRGSAVRIVRAVLTTVSRNGELALGVGLRHGDGSIGTGTGTGRDGMGST